MNGQNAWDTAIGCNCRRFIAYVKRQWGKYNICKKYITPHNEVWSTHIPLQLISLLHIIRQILYKTILLADDQPYSQNKKSCHTTNFCRLPTIQSHRLTMTRVGYLITLIPASWGGGEIKRVWFVSNAKHNSQPSNIFPKTVIGNFIKICLYTKMQNAILCDVRSGSNWNFGRKKDCMGRANTYIFF